MDINVEIKTLKEIPKKQIEMFEDKVVYNTALYTREFTKNSNAYPYLTGKLERNEVALPIEGKRLEYSLGSGVDYAMYIWKKNKAHWTNPSTQPQWYYSVFRKQGATIVHQAINTSLKEI